MMPSAVPSSGNEQSRPEFSDAINEDRAADPATLAADLRARFKVLADFRPLKIKIHLDIRAALDGSGTANVRIARALHYHTGHGLYLKALADGGPRYNLAGEIEGEVTEEQRRHAIQQIKERQRARQKKPKPPAPPEPDPAPAQADDAPPARPTLKLKPKAGPVVASAVISRREVKP